MANNKKRETAWRVFASEFNASTLKIQGGEDFSPNYVISPLGAKMNRVLIMGVVTVVRNLNEDKIGEEPLYRLQLDDPTGTFFVTSGQFNPEITSIIADLPFPCIACIVGKTRAYSPDEDTFLLSVSPEIVKEVSDDVYKYWIVETARSTKSRIDTVRKAHELEGN